MANISALTRWFVTGALGLTLVAVAGAEAPQIFAIRGARIVPVAGPPIESGTIVIRSGLVEAVGASLVVPADAVVIEGQGLTVYPGLIDMGSQAGIEVPAIAAPREPRTRLEVERWKRQVLLRPDVEAARCLKADPADLKKFASVGITSALAVPGGGAISGQSSILHVIAPDDDPQIGNIADRRDSRYVVKTPVFLHVRFIENPPGDAYPDSLMGVIAFVRQAFLDAGYAHTLKPRSGQPPRSATAAPVDPSLDALLPALEGRQPVVFGAQEAQEIRRVLRFAKELKLDPIIAGGLEADQVIEELKAQKARVILSVNYPTRPRTLAPEADENLRTLTQRAHAPAVASALEKAGVPFAFASDGLKEPADFVKNVAKAVKAGLGPEAALRAMTLGAATLAGTADRLGSIERGKIANLVVTDGDLFGEKMVIRHVFVAGRPIVIEPAAPRTDSRATK